MSKPSINKKTKIIIGAVLLIGIAIGGAIALRANKPAEIIQPPSKKPKKQVNLIPLEERPYVTLRPLSARNMAEVTIHDLKKPAKTVEVTLEYDRNKGVLDAVLNTFNIDATPLVKEMFLGSKSAGGHTTYHDDVIGGAMTLDFTDENYALEVPWRYQDNQKSYDMLSTSDGKFQLKLDKPIMQPKVIIMQSPGLPLEISGKVLAGPYFVGTVGDLPKASAEIKMVMAEESSTAVIYGYDGKEWVKYDATIDGRTIQAKGTLLSTFIVVNP